ncbi:PIR protein [Plasmodium vivax]|uniref:VIR protein n=1 Tax=Plasmodium vivax TaxID=5855 RepID=A0A565A4U2_PLAVI|nr:PIR protein [Plasmodium vivax]
MSYEDYIKDSKLNVLISKMNVTNRDNCCVLTDVYLKSVDHTKREKLKNIGCSVECGYSYLTALEYKKLTYLCKYLNLWLDEQKSTHINGISVITDAQWKLIDKLWNALDADEDYSKCIRQQNIHSISENKKHMELLTYCINRDHIKEMCEDVIEYTSDTQNFCPALSEYTDTYYEKFKSENPCLDNSATDNLYKYYVSQECNLYDMPKTFPKFDLHSKKVLYENNSIIAINKCTNTVESYGPVAKENRSKDEENPDRDAKNAARVEVNASEGKYVHSKLDDHKARLGDDRAKLDVDPAEHAQLDIPSPTGDLNGDDATIRTMHGNSIEEITSPKLGTIGATLAGSSLFLIMMYKYTPLGSWVSTRILGRNKLMENMKKNNYELLLSDVGNQEASLNDMMYHISYNSSSNQ